MSGGTAAGEGFFRQRDAAPIAASTTFFSAERAADRALTAAAAAEWASQMRYLPELRIADAFAGYGIRGFQVRAHGETGKLRL